MKGENRARAACVGGGRIKAAWVADLHTGATAGPARRGWAARHGHAVTFARQRGSRAYGGPGQRRRPRTRARAGVMNGVPAERPAVFAGSRVDGSGGLGVVQAGGEVQPRVLVGRSG
jgi:hypothetical protein